MNNTAKRFVAVIGIGLAFMPIDTAFAQSLEQLSQLTAEWWHWALSIPTSVNPQTDTTGEDAVVGQRGSVWFLAGRFGGGKVTRKCSVPQGVALFFPVINQINFNTPNVCGQESGNLSVNEMRAASRAFIDGATNLSVRLDGKAITSVRLTSTVFAVALPEDNVFAPGCAQFGGIPSGVYSPAVDDGFYIRLDPLSVGHHTLRFHAERPNTDPSQSFIQDVMYNITVVPVLLK